MTAYDDAEASVEDGSPIELYKFAYGGQTLLYTSGDIEVSYLGDTYVPAAISRSDVSGTSDADQGAASIKMAGVTELISLLRDEPPGEIVNLTIFRQQETAPSEFRVVWFGEIHGSSFEGNEFKVQTNSALQSEKRMGLSQCWQKSCPHALYDPSTCKANKNLFGVNATTVSLTSHTLIATDLVSALDMRGGYIEYDDLITGVKSRRTIVAHNDVTGAIQLASVTRNMTVGTQFVSYPGCDHSLGANGCAKFDNKLNYGGDPALPLTNPYSADEIPF